MPFQKIRIAAWVVALATLTTATWAQLPEAPQAEAADDEGAGPLNVTAPTLGGSQFWSDQLIFRDWRIQKNLVLGHCRLLDDKNFRRAWGTFDECRSELDRLRRDLHLQSVSGPVILVLHGLGRTRNSMSSLCEYLEQQTQCVVLNMSYATTRGTVDEHAASLASVLTHLDPGVTRVDFVAHSLGNLVIRRHLHDRYGPASNGTTLPPVGRIVMLGPPNQGSQFAQRFPRNALVHWIGGDSMTQLAARWEQLSDKLATPRGEFGIIAGGQRDGDGGNLLLEGDNDFVVSVQETRLPGARDFAIVPAYHGIMMNDPTVRQYTLRFLQHGYFRSEAAREPISE
jgi:hypothetical protein